jgi:multidrug efflux pump subunit AcrA (membrane-fusion protein)
VKAAGISKTVTAVILILIAAFLILIAFTVTSRYGAARETPGRDAALREPQEPGGPSRDRETQGAEAGRGVTAIRVSEVVRGTIENSVVINGDVLARNQVAVYPTVGGKLVEARFGVGDQVRRGEVVALVNPSRPGEVYSDSPVTSPISGTVLQAPYSPGDTLSTSSPVYVVGDLSSLVVETFVPERFAAAARKDLPAQVTLEALPGEVFTARVDEVSPVLDPASRTMRIRLRFGSGAADSRIKAGMFATISLVTNTRSGVPVIPRASAINTYGSWIVFTVDENNIARRREVELGLENENFFEVTSGLEAGDLVVSAGQNFLSDGDPVRIVDQEP